MGGLGSTRWLGHKRLPSIDGEEGHLRLSIGQLRYHLTESAGGTRALIWPAATFTAAVTHRPEFVHEKGWSCAELVVGGTWILLLGEPERLAGVRWWFSCPECGRHRESLFTDPIQIVEMWKQERHGEEPERHWRCRECIGLTYRIGQLNELERALRRVRKIVRRLKVSPEVWDVRLPPPPRPKNMKAAIYRMLRQQYCDAADTYEEILIEAQERDLRQCQSIVENMFRRSNRAIIPQDLDKCGGLSTKKPRRATTTIFGIPAGR